MAIWQLALLAVQLCLSGTRALENGLARTPQRGWNPYNAFSCSTTDAMYNQQANLIKSLGLLNAGYEYLILDCGWQGTNRTSSGQFTWDTTRIPHGIPTLVNNVHAVGLKFGVYSDAGYYSCDDQGGNAHWIGSLGFEAQDARTFASWGADYLKYDNCFSVSPTNFVNYNPPFNLSTHYETMRDALSASGRPILFSMCEWGVQDPARWATPVGNSWRMSNDIGPPPSWGNILRIINQVVPITGFAGPGHWNDLDLLEVGNSGLSADEQQSHFSFWSAVKSPLIISTDLTKISSTALSLLTNPGLKAIHQDPLGAPVGFKRRYTNSYDVWSGPLSDGSTVVVLLNWMGSTNTFSFSLADVGLSSANAMNVVTGASMGRISGSTSITLPAHGSIVLKLSSVVTAAPPSFTYYLAAGPNTVLAGGANTRTVNSSTIVGNVGNGGTLTFKNVDGGNGGSKLVSVDYINADFTYSNTNCSNCRNGYVSVNGNTPVQVNFPISGQTWNILYSGYLVELSGFRAGTSNTITWSNNQGGAYAPDFYRIGVAH